MDRLARDQLVRLVGCELPCAVGPVDTGHIITRNEPPMTTVLSTRTPADAVPRFAGAPSEIAPGVLMCSQFSNSYAVKTGAGLLMIDSGIVPAARQNHAAVRAWSTETLRTVVFTHGHIDHVLGLKPFLAAGDRPNIIAQENCPKRFLRYRLTQGLNQDINRRQFGDATRVFPTDFDFPTTTFRDGLNLRLGDLDVRLTAAKGETDDHCYVWLPEKGYLFCGDLIIWRAPNAGNPQKVQRYPVEWAETLEAIAALDADTLFPGHGLVIEGRTGVRQVLTETAQYLRHIIDQVLQRLNAGEAPDDIAAAVTSHPTLSKRPYLLELYDHPTFVVRNLIRGWAGWWNGNAADLMPAPASSQAMEIANLAGGVPALIARGRVLLAGGDSVMAMHIAEWATRALPADAPALTFKRDVYEQRLSETDNLMIAGVYRDAMNAARRALGQEPLHRRGSPLAL